MKTRESGMPPEEMWHSFFDPKTVLAKLGLTADCQCVVDFGCGYGTFSVPAARLVRGTVHAIDIDPAMVEATRANGTGLVNLHIGQRDFVETGCGLADNAVDYLMLFNILHAAEAHALLAEALRVLRPGGKLAVMHWNYDPSTPRGPSLDIRLTPRQSVELVEQAGFHTLGLVNLPPFHYGFIGLRT